MFYQKLGKLTVYNVFIFRQERNRDAALRSREKKKLYVKELEMKSKYFEGECKRLGMLLNCVSAENHALRLSVQSSKAFDVSRTKQESAVLFLGMNLQIYPFLFFSILLIVRLYLYRVYKSYHSFLSFGLACSIVFTNPGQESLLLLQELNLFFYT